MLGDAELARLSIFSGRASRELAASVTVALGLRLGAASTSTNGGETVFRLLESVRRRDAYVIQSTCAPANDNLMELLIMADALRRASVGSITAVIPYFGYARQDRTVTARTPVTARLCADLLVAAGIDRVVCLDVHSKQVQGYFTIPFEHLRAFPVFVRRMRLQASDRTAVVAPDVGSIDRARAYADLLAVPLAIVDKRRDKSNRSKAMHVIGSVDGADCILIDDILDSAQTLCNAAEVLIASGARSVVAYATHGVFSAGAVERLTASWINEVVVSDSVSPSPAARACPRVAQVSIAPVMAEAIRRIQTGESVSAMLADDLEASAWLECEPSEPVQPQ